MATDSTVVAPRPVPFLDLGAQHAPLLADFVRDFEVVARSGQFVNGPQVREFEQAFAAAVGTEHCVAVASGLDALRLGLLAADIGPGDEVVVPALTFTATFEAVSQTGAVPVPVDVSETDYCLDPEGFVAAIGPRTRAVIPVDLYGQVADMAAIRRAATDAGLFVLEDACQAHGASRDGIRAGSAGTAAFSFYPGKNLGAFGDAGALVTSSAEIAETVRQLREHGQSEKYVHVRIGYTARLDTLQAAVLLRKLPFLEGWNEERRAIADRYLVELADIEGLTLPHVAPASHHVWHLFVVRSTRRHELAAHLRDAGVSVGLHYPEPPHLSAAYAGLGRGPGSYPVSEQLAREVLSLPIFPGMTDSQVGRVVTVVRAFFGD